MPQFRSIEMPGRHAFVAPVVAALTWALSVTASAQTRIGTTVGLSPLAEVSHAGSLVLGASIIQDEVVRTGPAGALELQFLDGTHLALDRSSSVKLDKFVYSVSRRGDQVVIGLTKGAFRFATGGLPKAAYRIQTPLASIGVRGTILTIVSSGTRLAFPSTKVGQQSAADAALAPASILIRPPQVSWSPPTDGSPG
jgi:ferric-dicitrate binding protein FerR (iron transport regulator)